MKLVYADPPYFGQCKSYEHFHNDGGAMPWDGHCWDEEQTHLDLLAWLTENADGWAYSCNPSDAARVGSFGRVGSWCKTFHQIRPKLATQHALELVIFKESRPLMYRKPMVRDWLTSSIAMKKGQRGAKPDVFNDWILALIGYEVGDEFTDLFPGSHSMQRAIDRKIEAGETDPSV